MPTKSLAQSTTKSTTSAQPTTNEAPATINLAKHHSEMSHAFATGADCANRVSTMIDAAIAVVKIEIPTGHHSRLILKFLKECQYMSEDLAGMLESELDSQSQYATSVEVSK